MPWKKNEDGALTLDEKGNPIWTSESGEEKGFDYLDHMKRLAEANAESKERKEKIRALEAKYRIFDGIEDLAQWKSDVEAAVEFRKNAPEKDKQSEAEMAKRIEAATAPLKVQIAERDKKIAEGEKSLQEAVQRINGFKVSGAVSGSKTLQERMSPEFRKLIGRELVRVGDVDEDGNVFFRGADGKPIYGEDGYASADAAVERVLKSLGLDPANVLLSPSTTNGSGSSASGSSSGASGPQTMKRTQFDALSPQERMEAIKSGVTVTD